MSDEQRMMAEPDERHPSSSFWPDAALVAVAAIWGINIPLMKNGLDRVDLYVFNAVRLTVSAATLCAFAWRETRVQGYAHFLVHWKQILVYSALISIFYQLSFLVGVSETTSGNAALIISSIPLWTALLAHIFLTERLHAVAWCGLATAMAGTVFVAFQKGNVTAVNDYLIGNLSVLGAAVLWAGGTVYSRPLMLKVPPLQLAAASTLIALPVHLMVAGGKLGADIDVLTTPSMVFVIIYSGVLSSGLAVSMWNYGVRYAGAAHGSVIQNLVPVFAMMAAWLTRGESASLEQLCGGGLILGGLILMRFYR